MYEHQNASQLKTKFDLEAGDVILYPFLWGWEVDRGNTFAYKMRPCVVVAVYGEGDDKYVALLPVTTADADKRHTRFPIPATECQSGSIHYKGAEIGLDELNIDRISTSGALRHHVPQRSFSPGFMRALRQELLKKHARTPSRRIVRREMKNGEMETVSQFA